MAFVLHPWQLRLAILTAWINQQQQQIIEFQRTEIDVLKEKLGKRRILLTDDQRRRLAVRGESPRTRSLGGNRYTLPRRKSGRPTTCNSSSLSYLNVVPVF